MEVSRAIQLCDFGPLVLCNLIDFALFGRLIRVLRANGEEEVLCAILEAFVKMG